MNDPAAGTGAGASGLADVAVPGTAVAAGAAAAAARGGDSFTQLTAQLPPEPAGSMFSGEAAGAKEGLFDAGPVLADLVTGSGGPPTVASAPPRRRRCTRRRRAARRVGCRGVRG